MGPCQKSKKDLVCKKMFKFQHPFTCLCAGPTSCGKSTFVKRVIDTKIIEPQPEKIMWLYAEDQPLYHTLKQVTFHKGIPDDIEDLFDVTKTNLLIIDDLMTKCHSDERLTRLFSVGSHHKNLSIIFIVHNIFHQGKEMRNISLNTHYIVLFKNPRDNQQISTLARQIYPNAWRFLVEVFRDATSMPHGYLLLDFKHTTPDTLRIRTGLFPDATQYVYTKENVSERSFVIEQAMEEHVSKSK